MPDQASRHSTLLPPCGPELRHDAQRDDVARYPSPAASMRALAGV